jgi:hypothetical protein
MFRKAAIVCFIALLGSVAACGSRGTATGTAAAQRPAVGRPAAVAAARVPVSACLTQSTKALATSRFAVNAGLAAGAFTRYIYAPYAAGTFTTGAASAKAAAAGAFVLGRLNAASQVARGNPALYKMMVAPTGTFASAVEGLVTGAKAGDISGSDVTSAWNALQDFRSAAANAGASFKDVNATVG